MQRVQAGGPGASSPTPQQREGEGMDLTAVQVAVHSRLLWCCSSCFFLVLLPLCHDSLPPTVYAYCLPATLRYISLQAAPPLAFSS